MENLKNVAPIEDFNWDASENGETVTNVSHDELEKAYDGTLNKVNDREVVDGTVIAMNKREDRKSTRLNSSHTRPSRMPSSA